MTDHLPECGYSPGQPGWGSINGGVPQKYIQPSPCICDQLRACEQRVRDELFPLRWNRAEQLEGARVNGWHAGWNAALEDGYAAGLDAAREAIRAIPMDDMCCMCPTDEGLTLAAIDALREKP